MPRFCSSNTRPNSLAIGARHFLGDQVEAGRQAVAGRSAREISSRASGSCVANCFNRLRRRNSSHISGRTASDQAHRQHERWVHAGKHRHEHADHGHDGRRCRRTAVGVSVVSACSNSRLKLPNRWRQTRPDAGAGRSPAAAPARCSLSRASLACLRAGRAGQHGQAVFDLGSVERREAASPAPPTRAATPTNAAIEINQGLMTMHREVFDVRLEVSPPT